MCNPYAMMAANLMQMKQQKEALKIQREYTKKSYKKGVAAEEAREDQESIALRMEADKISRETGRAAGETSVVMAGAGVEIVGLVEQWGQLEHERLGTLSAKERMLAVAGDYRLEELVDKRDQLLAAQAEPIDEDWMMAAISGWIQGAMIQKTLQEGTTETGERIPGPAPTKPGDTASWQEMAKYRGEKWWFEIQKGLDFITAGTW